MANCLDVLFVVDAYACVCVCARARLCVCVCVCARVYVYVSGKKIVWSALVVMNAAACVY